MKRIVVCGTVLAVAVGAAVAAAPRGAPSSPRDPVDVRPSHVATSRFPLLLVENRGQTDPDVTAYARGRRTSVFFTGSGVTYGLSKSGRKWAVNADFVDARSNASRELLDPAPTVLSWFKGPREKWIAGVPTFRRLAYRGLWPGIDLEWIAEGDELKYEFVVQPGADPSRIRIAWRGADELRTAADGSLVVATPVEDLREEAPVAFQDEDGRRRTVDAAFDVADARDGRAIVGFRLGAYDPRRPLIVDPPKIVYAGYIGGDAEDTATGVAVDDLGAAYVVGSTNSSEPTFPRTVGPDLSQNGDLDAYVAKVAPDGASLEYVGYIGGDGIDRAAAVAVDATRHAYVVGDSHSSRGSFPAPVNPLELGNPSENAFVVKLDPSGASITWSLLFGGADAEVGTAVALDASDNVYLAGTTRSTQFSFPVLVGPGIAKGGGDEDAFVAKIDAGGAFLDYAGFIGAGGSNEEANGIAVDSDGAAYVAGRADGPNFPFTVGPETTAKGGVDAFVAKVKPDGSGFDYAGFIGGAGDDRAYAVAVDDRKRAYVVGSTTSSEATFPVLVGPTLVRGTNVGPPSFVQDAFVCRVRPDGAGVEYCGYIGGKEDDAAYGVAVNSSYQAFVVGTTASNFGSFPVVSGPDLKGGGSGGHTDAFLARVRSDASGFVSSGFIGGLSDDQGKAVALGPNGSAYVVGLTKSLEATFPVKTGPDLTRNSSGISNTNDGFVARASSSSSLATVGAYVLPSKATATFNAKNASKSKLVVTGVLGLGTIDPCWTVASTLDVAGFHYDIPAFSAFKTVGGFRYDAPADATHPALSFQIIPNAAGDSKATFSLTLTGDISSSIPRDGALDVSFVTDAGAATGSLRLAKGKFLLSAPHGGFAEPCVFVGRASGKLLGPGKDSLSFTLGFATDGTTPTTTSDVTVAFGSFSRTISAADFKRRGAKHVFSDPRGDVTSVVVDYAKQTVTVGARSLTLGTFAQGPNALAASVEIGDVVHETQVVVTVSGTKLSY